MKLEKSLALLQETKRLIPVAASTYSKSYRYFSEGAVPSFLKRGSGSHVWDVDDNEYIDYVLALGPVIVGYNDERINAAITDQLKNGISFSLSTEYEMKLAQKLVEIIPCAEMVKFVKNGSDATTAAVRLARAFTGRDRILSCGYHGWHDWHIGATPHCKGVPGCVRDLTIAFPYNDLSALERILEQYRGETAAIVMEPMSLEEPQDGFLQHVKELAKENGALLIFDEVVTGFRMGLAGAQGYFGVVPDLACFGKAMGNGMAISALVGRADVLKLIEEGVFVSTTFGGETLSIAAALKSIEILEEEKPFEKFSLLGKKLMNGMNAQIETLGLSNDVGLVGLPYHFALRFKERESITTYDLLTIFQQEAAKRGVLMLGVHNFCLAHTTHDIEKTLEAYAPALEMVRKAIEEGCPEKYIEGKKIEPVFRRDSSR